MGNGQEKDFTTPDITSRFEEYPPVNSDGAVTVQPDAQLAAQDSEVDWSTARPKNFADENPWGEAPENVDYSGWGRAPSPEEWSDSLDDTQYELEPQPPAWTQDPVQPNAKTSWNVQPSGDISLQPGVRTHQITEEEIPIQKSFGSAPAHPVKLSKRQQKKPEMSKKEKRLAKESEMDKKNPKWAEQRQSALIKLLVLALFSVFVLVQGMNRIESANELINSAVLLPMNLDDKTLDEMGKKIEGSIEENYQEYNNSPTIYKYIDAEQLSSKSATDLAIWFKQEFSPSKEYNHTAFAEFNLWYAEKIKADPEFDTKYKDAITYVEAHPEMLIPTQTPNTTKS